MASIETVTASAVMKLCCFKVNMSLRLRSAGSPVHAFVGCDSGFSIMSLKARVLSLCILQDSVTIDTRIDLPNLVFSRMDLITSTVAYGELPDLTIHP